MPLLFRPPHPAVNLLTGYETAHASPHRTRFRSNPKHPLSPVRRAVPHHKIRSAVPIAIALLIKGQSVVIDLPVPREPKNQIARSVQTPHGLTAGRMPGYRTQFIVKITRADFHIVQPSRRRRPDLLPDGIPEFLDAGLLIPSGLFVGLLAMISCLPRITPDRRKGIQQTAMQPSRQIHLESFPPQRRLPLRKSMNLHHPAHLQFRQQPSPNPRKTVIPIRTSLTVLLHPADQWLPRPRHMHHHTWMLRPSRRIPDTENIKRVSPQPIHLFIRRRRKPQTVTAGNPAALPLKKGREHASSRLRRWCWSVHYSFELVYLTPQPVD